MSDGKLKGLLLAVVGVACIAAIGIYYKRVVQPSEPTWDGSGRTWPAMPLQVEIGPDIEADAVESAIATWNGTVGCELFHTTSGGKPQVRIMSSSAEATCGGTAVLGGHERAGTWICQSGATSRAEVLVSQPGTVDDLYRIVAHELGHVLALDHDTAPRSVMRNPLGDDPVVRLSDKDRRALQERYCHVP
jgi:predicted Zn-dependent protease